MLCDNGVILIAGEPHLDVMLIRHRQSIEHSWLIAGLHCER